ncbi:MAG: hypothetical protein IPP66_02520 [Anaerolineales bacterium]|nr:hypothetical protein [Anaerolineales bacterium]
MKQLLFIVTISLLVSACGTSGMPTLTSTPSATSSVTIRESVTESVYLSATPHPLSVLPSTTPPVTPSATVRESVTESVYPSVWKEWPVIPVLIDPSLQKVYERGLSLGNDPHAFSIFGDCQTRPGEFFGVFETDSSVVQSLSPELQETIAYFNGSFNRESSTAQDGTTPGALLWTQWHRGEYGCTFAETPVECEIRTHHPSFVIIQIGSHFESRNTEYLRKIILQLLDAGVIPILATKADNREKDERINRDMALLASEYDLPLWNFWAAVSDLPNRGLYTRSDRPQQGDIYLTEEAAQIHRMTALETLNIVWRAVTGK